MHKQNFYTSIEPNPIMQAESIVISNNESVIISQTTDSDGQEIQTVILNFNEAEEIVEFN